MPIHNQMETRLLAKFDIKVKLRVLNHNEELSQVKGSPIQFSNIRFETYFT